MKIKREILIKIYNDKTALEAARILKISTTTLRTLVRKNNIPMKGKGRHGGIGRSKIEVVD